MTTFLGVLIIVIIIFCMFYLGIFWAVRTIGHHHTTHEEHVPNGQTSERATRLERESERYRNVLVDNLIRDAEERRRRR